MYTSIELTRINRSLVYSLTGPRSAVGNVSGYRCVSDCNSRGREFDPGPAPYFRGDWAWNNFYGHSPPFRWFIQEVLLSVTSESMCTNYWLSACSSLPRRGTDRPAMTIAVDLGRKATKQTNKNLYTHVQWIGHLQKWLFLFNDTTFYFCNCVLLYCSNSVSYW